MRTLIVILLFCFTTSVAQKKEVSFKAWDGAVVAGYIDKGAFVNFTGPGVKWTRRPCSLLIGVLPSIKIKEDKSAVKNSFLTPSLGAGITFAVKKLVLQLPFYYIPKTATENGQWKTGLGLGYKM